MTKAAYGAWRSIDTAPANEPVILYSPRVCDQMQRVRNVIVIQGVSAAQAFGVMIAKQQKEPNG